MLPRKHERENLHARYRFFFQISLIASLVLVLVAFKAEIASPPRTPDLPPPPDVIPVEHPPNSVHPEKAPPPPRPSVLAVVPDDAELEEVPIDLDPLFPVDEAPSPPRMPPPPENPRASDETNEPFWIVEQMPELVGGLQALHREIRYPQMAVKAGVEGRVFVQFVVDADGSVTDAKVLRGIGAGCDEEAIRALRQMRFEPGRQRGKAVRVRMSLPIVFRLR